MLRPIGGDDVGRVFRKEKEEQIVRSAGFDDRIMKYFRFAKPMKTLSARFAHETAILPLAALFSSDYYPPLAAHLQHHDLPEDPARLDYARALHRRLSRRFFKGEG